jgi:hypothetical protein
MSNNSYSENKNEEISNTCINENGESLHKIPIEKKIMKINLSTCPSTSLATNNVHLKHKKEMNEINEKQEKIEIGSDFKQNDDDEKKEERGESSFNKILLGRKKKNSNREGKHTKYSEDNIIRKIKAYVVSCLRIFINAFIFEIYEGQIGKGIFRKELLKLNQSQIIDSKNNRDFLNKSLKDIFSEDISTKYNNYLVNHNKALIQNLLNEPDPNKKITFENLFNLTFLDCLLHIRGEKYYEQLHGLKTFDELCKRFEDDNDYLELFKYYIINFEKVINKKRKRSSSKSY